MKKICAMMAATLLPIAMPALADGYPTVYAPDGQNLTTKRMNGWADLSGWYAGVGVGSSDYHGEFGNSSDSSSRLYAGYEFHPYWAIEGAWVDLGEYDQPHEQFHVNGLQVAGIGMLPVWNRLSLLGKAGIIHWDADQTGNGTEGLYGVGLKYDVTDRFTVRGEMEVYNDVHNKEIKNYTAGVQYRLQRKRPDNYYQ